MSKENAAAFLYHITEDQELRTAIDSAERTAEAWTAIAQQLGHRFSTPDLAAIVAELEDPGASIDDLYRERIAETPEGDALSDEALATVNGGAALFGALRNDLFRFGYRTELVECRGKYIPVGVCK